MMSLMKKKSKAEDSTTEMPVEAVEELKAESIKEDEPTLPKMPLTKAEPAPAMKSYRVKKETRVNLNGYQAIVMPDQVVSRLTHGEEGLRQLSAQGVELEEVK